MARFESPILMGFLIVTMLLTSLPIAQAQLFPGFYNRRCFPAVGIIRRAVFSALAQRPAAAAGVLRLHFHDCFVHGCDGSVLIDSPSEKDAFPNLTLQGFDVIDAAKTAIEARCPGVVSCADILAIAAEVAVERTSGGQIGWQVPLGRRDGLVSSAAAANAALPPPTDNAANLKANFAAVGLSPDQMVTLSGAHTIGVAHCGAFQNRLTTPPDPSLNPIFAFSLKRQCPAGSNNIVNLDVSTPNRFDSFYFTNLQERRGLLTSDQALQTDPSTRGLVALNANPFVFRRKFPRAMIAMGNINVLTGFAGQIRLNCHKFN